MAGVTTAGSAAHSPPLAWGSDGNPRNSLAILDGISAVLAGNLLD
jgi:hypothetical protein